MERWRKVVKKCIPSARLSLCLMVFWGQIQNYMMRSTLSLLIVAMVDQQQKNSSNNYTEMTCLADKVENETVTISSDSDHGETLHWEESQIGQVLGAFNIGYVCTQVCAEENLSISTEAL